jgi:hypothetical protein
MQRAKHRTNVTSHIHYRVTINITHILQLIIMFDCNQFLQLIFDIFIITFSTEHLRTGTSNSFFSS